jgi:hypothetical protein
MNFIHTGLSGTERRSRTSAGGARDGGNADSEAIGASKRVRQGLKDVRFLFNKPFVCFFFYLINFS